MDIEVIERLGGTRPAAKALHVPVSTVANWVKKGKIPTWREPAIEQALRALGRVHRAVDGQHLHLGGSV